MSSNLQAEQQQIDELTQHTDVAEEESPRPSHVIISPEQIKKLNSRLAHSSQQTIRDRALDEAVSQFTKGSKSAKSEVEGRVWFEEPLKHSRMLWEGMFFMFWHADKSVYQRDTALKIASLLKGLGDGNTPQVSQLAWTHHQRLWLESCLYIFNKHWDKVDNFRIDKYLMLVRQIFAAANAIFKETNYNSSDVEWYSTLLKSQFANPQAARGLLLQIVDVFVPELNKVNSQISLANLAALLEPFLYTLANTSNKSILERVRDNIFQPLLQANVTEYSDDSEQESSEEEDLRAVDGGKPSQKTRKHLKEIINQKFVFEYMNILMYAENYVFKTASLPEGEGILEDNREQLYTLYNYALQLEPERKPELTFSQRMLVNRARQFITKRMRRRVELRQAKQSKKQQRQARAQLSQKLYDQFKTQIQDQAQGAPESSQEATIKEAHDVLVREIKAEKPSVQQEQKDQKQKDSQPKKKFVDGDTGKSQPVFKVEKKDTPNESELQHSSTGSNDDLVMTIPSKQQSLAERKRMKKLKRKEAKAEPQSTQAVAAAPIKKNKKHIMFDLKENKTREFHKFERVKTQLLPKSLERNKLKDGLKPAIKQHSVDAYMKKREMKHQNKSKQRFLF